ncbi:MAG: TonB-dependent receptor [Methylococcales bacterium]
MKYLNHCFNKKHSIQIPVFFSLFLLAHSRFLMAEEMDDYFSMSPEQLANISVTIASGTAKPVYQSASVTSVITAKQIKSMGATELSQVLETVPGLHVSIQAVTNDAVYTMRGMQNVVNNQVLMLLNGTRYSVPYKGSFMQGMQLPVEAIQQIEVIRGPGSALYGADAFAGVINIVTKKAKDIAGTEVGVRGGSWDTQSVWGLHSGHGFGWDVAATLQYAHNNNDGDRIISSDAQSQFDKQLGTSASLTPNEMQTKAERWDAHLNLQRKYWDINFWAFNEVDAGLRAGTAGALDTKGRVNGENYLTDLRFSSEDLIENWELLAHASYLYTNVDSNLHLFPDGSKLPIDTTGNVNPKSAVGTPLFPDGVLDQIRIQNQVFSFEMGSIYKGFNDHLLRVSSEFRYEQLHTKERRNFGASILNGTETTVDGTLTDVTGTQFIFMPNSYRTIWSVVLQDEWQIASDWQLTAGVRFDNYSDFGSTFNPRVALLWEVTQQLSAKVLYGQAFRAPSFLEQKQQNSALFNGNPNLKPETIETIELAFDYRPISNLRFASNFYYYDIKDLIAQKTAVLTADNTKGQTAYGTEFEWDWKLNKQWDLKGNYAWQYATDKQTKRRVANVPEHQVYMAVTWNFLAKWQLQTQLNWIGRRLNSETSTNNQLKDYETIDVTLNSKRYFDRIDFSASVRNIFDAQGKEAAVNSYKDNLPIASRSFYLQTTIHF